MKKGLRKILSAVAVLIAALPCAVSPVLANSGPRAERGEKASGTIVRNENSVLAVESEKLTFDICDFPVRRDEELNEYKSTVTAEYKFVNTSSDTVHTSMAFPNPVKGNYIGGNQDFLPSITVDGKEVGCEVRYTVDNYSNFDSCVQLISDEWYSDSFYSPDMPVTKYNVSVNRPADYDKVLVSGEAEFDLYKARYVTSGYRLDFYFDFTDNGAGGLPYAYNTNNNVNYFYVIGDTSAFSCEWHTEAVKNERHPYDYSKVDIPYSVTAEKATTLKEFILSTRSADSPIGELDYFNAVVRSLNFTNGGWAGHIDELHFDEKNALAWYLYDVTVEPNGSIINKITAPIFPHIQYYYDPYVYVYEYYLSPAAKWADFGKLEVRINSEYYLVNPPKGFEKCEGGYKAEFSSLPYGELEFRMCSVENPDTDHPARVIGIIFLVLLCIICIVVPLAVFAPFIVKAVKKRRAERALDFSSRRD